MYSTSHPIPSVSGTSSIAHLDSPTANYQITGIQLAGDIGQIELTGFHPECEHRKYGRTCLLIRGVHNGIGSQTQNNPSRHLG
jgi:hypothetical protein